MTRRYSIPLHAAAAVLGPFHFCRPVRLVAARAEAKVRQESHYQASEEDVICPGCGQFASDTQANERMSATQERYTVMPRCDIDFVASQ